MNTLKNAVLYIRVSTDEQAKYGYSIDMQQTQCFNFAMREGYNVIGTYIDDGYTARNPNRPQYKKLFEDIKSKKNGINYVIVWRCDRMVRNTNLYHSEIVPKFAKYGVGLLSATENNDMNNPYGRYMRNTQINFIYKGLITCQKTGKTFCGELQKGSNKSGEYEYYRCHHACPYSENCKRIIKKSIIDESVNDMLSSMTITKEQFEDYKEDMRRMIAVNKKLNFERLGQIEKQINKLENRLGALYDDKLDGLIAEDLYMRKRNLWQGQIDELMLELTGLRKNQGEIYNKVDGLLELCKDLCNVTHEMIICNR